MAQLTIPANTKHSPNAILMLAHRLRRWTSIKTALGECLVFAGMFALCGTSENYAIMVAEGRE